MVYASLRLTCIEKNRRGLEADFPNRDVYPCPLVRPAQRGVMARNESRFVQTEVSIVDTPEWPRA
jgi:hypothetical protein